ncbi:hypothetical protein SBV1_270049 [Verrucomicrobia bacterium]|nr:hypothetical protein SBV1_270049 [Verrucomicrobiota bacterium]
MRWSGQEPEQESGVAMRLDGGFWGLFVDWKSTANLGAPLRGESLADVMMGVRKGARVVGGPELSGTPARGAIPFSSFPEVFAALRPRPLSANPPGWASTW